jgi:hypothetical protein
MPVKPHRSFFVGCQTQMVNFAKNISGLAPPIEGVIYNDEIRNYIMVHFPDN